MTRSEVIEGALMNFGTSPNKPELQQEMTPITKK
jgi:hypothetical protein